MDERPAPFRGFRYHPELVGKHAYLSPSKPHWLNYDDDKLIDSFDKHMTASRGTRLHNLAAELIDLGQKMANNQQTFNRYINDCIGYRMKPEVPLFVSWHAFGCCDAISFRKERDEDGYERFVLRIFDLKNGVTKPKEDQLKLYAAFFFLEYKIPASMIFEIELDLRIYQNDEVYQIDTDAEEIIHIMSRVKEANDLLGTLEEV